MYNMSEIGTDAFINMEVYSLKWLNSESKIINCQCCQRRKVQHPLGFHKKNSILEEP